MVSQDHAQLDSDIIADVIRLLVEVDPLIKVKSIIAEVQGRFNYTSFRHCKPLVQVDGMHLYGKYKGALLVAVAQDGNQNIVPIAFVIVEGETTDACEFFLTNLQRYVVTIDGVGIISDRYTSIDTAITRSNGAWSPPRVWHMYCIKHIRSNFLRRFKAPYLNHLVVNIGISTRCYGSIHSKFVASAYDEMVCSTGYSRTEQEYNKNYQWLKERGEAYTQWCGEIGVERWVLAFDGGHRWGHITTNLVECINSVLKGARNLPVTVLVRSTFYRLYELFTRKSTEAHERLCNGFTNSEFATKRVEESFRRAGNIVVNWFDRRNEMFEVREIKDGTIYTVNLVQQHCDCGHFQVERLPCCHVLACCANQRLHWQVYVHDV
ncbi:uncharacterized protein LOC127748430 [Arachis duranensis]|uniref:Uncharacterized protein LOC127748430 n=1 Tax=Arachis duranensis TaxID=130453 RepID=A0A9C6WUB2_ARADU|nr:uncharacterized protein LOC127748430 [Arachis duranensis]